MKYQATLTLLDLSLDRKKQLFIFLWLKLLICFVPLQITSPLSSTFVAMQYNVTLNDTEGKLQTLEVFVIVMMIMCWTWLFGLFWKIWLNRDSNLRPVDYRTSALLSEVFSP